MLSLKRCSKTLDFGRFCVFSPRPDRSTFLLIGFLTVGYLETCLGSPKKQVAGSDSL